MTTTSNEHPWWQGAAIYQIYPRSFADSGGDGIGDLPGITARLDYLKRLGIDAIWLSPFFPSPMADFGYDVADYTDVDPQFGTLADFDAMLAEAHARGIRVIIDWVPNHSSDQHPWFLESRRGRDSDKRDWYVWRDPAPGGGPPNAWVSNFRAVGPAWTFDDASGQYYLHSFLPEQPELNWENPEVRAAMAETLRFWLDRGVDGFRIDVVFKLAKDPALGDNEPGRRHDQDWVPTIHDRLRELRRVVDEYDDRMLVGEVYLDDLPRVAAYINSGEELHLAHNFVFVRLPWRRARSGSRRGVHSPVDPLRRGRHGCLRTTTTGGSRAGTPTGRSRTSRRGRGGADARSRVARNGVHATRVRSSALPDARDSGRPNRRRRRPRS